MTLLEFLIQGHGKSKVVFYVVKNNVFVVVCLFCILSNVVTAFVSSRRSSRSALFQGQNQISAR